MTGRFKPLKAILPSAQLLLWPQLNASVSLGLVLYGGTAIALRFGHRLSVDFNFFTERALDRETLQAAFPFLSQAVALQDERNTLTVLVRPDESVESFVKLSFFGNIDFGGWETPI